MTYRSILVSFDLDDPIGPLMGFGIDLATRLDARLIGFAAATIAPPLVAGDGIVGGGEFIQQEREAIDRRLAELKADFTKRVSTTVPSEWRGFFGEPTMLLAEMARAADLVVAATPQAESAFDLHRSADLGSLALRLGRPLLLAAAKAEIEIPKRALVAWKDAREARRAVADAVPLLALAQEVCVVTVAADADVLARESIADVAAYLSRHGIKAETEVIRQGDDAAGLLEFARSIRADLVVSGAYGHSRIREWVFGGVTRTLLGEARLNRFMSN